MPTRTELIWDGKYDEQGKRVAALRVALPFQTVETVNESAQERDKLFQLAMGDQPWRNRLVWGDKKYVLPSLLAEFAGKVNLIYIDPPFDTGADFSFTASVPPRGQESGGRGQESEDGDDGEDDSLAFTKEPSIIEQKAYRDTWGRGLDSYLQWFYEAVLLLHELLAENGSIYVHLDWHVGHYAKILLDDVFAFTYQSEVVWQKLRSAKSQSSHFSNLHDIILIYTKGESFTFNPQFGVKNPELLKTHYRHTDPVTGKRYNLDNFTQVGPGPPRRFGGKVLAPPPGKHWIWSQERIDEGMSKGLIVFSSGGLPYLKRFFDDNEGTRIGDIWTDINPINQVAKERLDYPTQKPEALLERIIKASSNENDLVLDCFVGSGTTAAVAEKLNRRWIACDLGRFAIHTTRKRLLNIANVRPFIVQNLGKYERQLWQAGEFAASSVVSGPSSVDHKGPGQLTTDYGQRTMDERQRAYVEFILKLYHATPVQGYTWLHGIKAGRMVHVGAVDAPVSAGDVTQIATEFKRAVGTGKNAPSTNGVDVLGWDFAFELNEIARQQAALANIKMQFKRIPRDVMDKRAVAEGDVKFFELAALAVDVKTKGQDATLKLTDFVIPPDDVPEEVRSAVKHWSQWIDYWAVDWDNKGDAFHNQWQAFRTRKDPKLPLSATYAYPEPGEYKVVVKVIDILGNDTTKTVRVKVT